LDIPKKSKGYQFYSPNHTTKFMDTRQVFLECDVSSIPMEIDLEKIQTYVPSAMTHDYIPTTIGAPHVVESTPLTENVCATPTIIENEDVPVVNQQHAEDFREIEVPLNNE
jgi:hypothetical protein